MSEGVARGHRVWQGLLSRSRDTGRVTETRRGRLDRIDSALGLFALGLWLALPAGLVAGLIGWGDVVGTFVLLAAAIGAGFILLDLAWGRRERRLLGGLFS